MTIQTQCTNRREMVRTISEFLGVEARYLYPPTFAYEVGNFTVNRDGSITCPEDCVDEAIALVTQLKIAGYITEDTCTAAAQVEDEVEQEAQPADEVEQQDAEPQPTDEVEQEDAEAQPTDEQEQDDLEAQPTDEVEQEDAEAQPSETAKGGVLVKIHTEGLDMQSAINLLKMIYSRQHILRAMLKSESIHIDEELVSRLQDEHPAKLEDVISILRDCCEVGTVSGVKLTEDTFALELPITAGDWRHGCTLMHAMVEKAKIAKRINQGVQTPAEDEMKYFARSWLIQMGLGGTSHTPLRHEMLDHLKGYAAFRQKEKMTAHNAKYAEIRRQRKAAEAAGAAELPNDDETDEAKEVSEDE